MKLIARTKSTDHWAVVMPEDDDELYAEDNYYSIAIRGKTKDGHEIIGTDKARYPTIAGVGFIGRIDGGDELLFILDPGYCAGIMMACEEVEKDRSKRVRIRRIPEDKAVAYLQNLLDKTARYQWMERQKMWGVPGYECGPEAWDFLPEPDDYPSPKHERVR